MPLDTHAAFRELENGGFDAKQAEVLVQVINGAMGAQATKADVEGVKAALEELHEDVMAAVKEQRNGSQAALKEQSDDFKKQFASKADLSNAKVVVRTEIVAASTRTILGTLLVATLLFWALKLFP